MLVRKFSKKNSYISVILGMESGNAVISVINDPDKGDSAIIGIPPECESEVFEPFYRLTSFVFEQYNSLDFGLGLTLVDKIISRHGGEVTAKNLVDYSDIKRDPQVKVNFSVTLPMIDNRKSQS